MAHTAADVRPVGKYTYEELAKWALCGDPHAARRLLEWEYILLARIERAIYHAVKAERDRNSQPATAVGGK